MEEVSNKRTGWMSFVYVNMQGMVDMPARLRRYVRRLSSLDAKIRSSEFRGLFEGTPHQTRRLLPLFNFLLQGVFFNQDKVYHVSHHWGLGRLDLARFRESIGRPHSISGHGHIQVGRACP